MSRSGFAGWVKIKHDCVEGQTKSVEHVRHTFSLCDQCTCFVPLRNLAGISRVLFFTSLSDISVKSSIPFKSNTKPAGEKEKGMLVILKEIQAISNGSERHANNLC